HCAAGLHEDELGAEMREHSLLLRGRPAPVERQQHDAGARETAQQQDVLDGILQRNADDIARQQPDRVEVRARLADEPVEVAKTDRPIPVYQRSAVRSRAGVVCEGLGDVQARPCALRRGRSISRISAVLATSAYFDAMSNRFTACDVALRS